MRDAGQAERAKRIQNKAMINEITEDDVNGLSDQICRLKEEIIRAKSECVRGSPRSSDRVGHYEGQNARESLRKLRESLNSSLILPGVVDMEESDEEKEEEMGEGDVTALKQLCAQISSSNSSSDVVVLAETEGEEEEEEEEDAFKDLMEMPPHDSHNDDDDVFLEGEEYHEAISGSSDSHPLSSHSLVQQGGQQGGQLESVTKSSNILLLSIVPPCDEQVSPIQEPTLCSSPRINTTTTTTTTTSNNNINHSSKPNNNSNNKRRGDGVRSSLQCTKQSPTESLAASLHHGLRIIKQHQHQRNKNNLEDSRKSFASLSFEHLALNSRQSIIHKANLTEAGQSSNTFVCSSCKKLVGLKGDVPNLELVPINESQESHDVLLQQGSNKDETMVVANATTSKREAELEAQCAEQAAKIKYLTSLVEQYNQGGNIQSLDGDIQVMKEPTHKESTCLEAESEHRGLNGDEENTTSEIVKQQQDNKEEKEALLAEIERLKEQLKSYTNNTTSDTAAAASGEKECLLDLIRNGVEEEKHGMEKERTTWMEAESKWISLTEELRLDLQSTRHFAETKEMELSVQKKCTAELDDALQRAIQGHARIVEDYAELQEMYSLLLEKHRGVMDGITQVKRVAAKAGRKGGCSSTAFAAALSAELSTLRIDREKERARLKEQNRRLRIQLRDTAEAVHAAGELLVRLREAEESLSLAQERYGEAQQENDRLKKQIEKIKKKHMLEMTTMKNYMAESRLPESALDTLYHHRCVEDEEVTARAPRVEESWRAAFRPSYQ